MYMHMICTRDDYIWYNFKWLSQPNDLWYEFRTNGSTNLYGSREEIKSQSQHAVHSDMSSYKDVSGEARFIVGKTRRIEHFEAKNY